MESLPKYFDHIRVFAHDDKKIYRANLQDEHDVRKWITEFAKLTNTTFSVHEMEKQFGYSCSKKYTCCYTDSQKILTKKDKQKDNTASNKQNRLKSGRCNMYVTICVKKNTVNEKKMEKFCKMGHLAIITIRNKHNHPMSLLKKTSFLKPANRIWRIFEKYFNDGLDATQSISLHKYKLLLKHKRGSSKISIPASPNFATVKKWYEKWKHENNNIQNIQQNNQTQETITETNNHELSDLCEKQIQNNNGTTHENCKTSIQIEMNTKQKSKLRNIRINHKDISQTSSVNSMLQRTDFDLFCQSLALELKQMSPDRAIICQQLLEKVMTDELSYQLSIKRNSLNHSILPAPSFPSTSASIPTICVQNQVSENSDETDLQPVFDLLTNNILFVRMKNCVPLPDFQRSV